MSNTIREILQKTEIYLAEKNIETARLDAELLLAHALGLSRLQIYIDLDRPLIASEIECLRLCLRRRGNREPLAYLLGHKEFYGLDFVVNDSVLIPRPETEEIVDRLILEASKDQPLRILDLGTGSGAIAVSLATHLPNAKILAIDCSEQAIRVAKENAKAHQVDHQILFLIQDVRNSDFLSNQNLFDWIVSNPPYLSFEDLEKAEPELMFEPNLALVSGIEGIELYPVLFSVSKRLLKPEGKCLFEIGSTQAKVLQALAENQGFLAKIWPDLSGKDRMLEITHPRKDSL